MGCDIHMRVETLKNGSWEFKDTEPYGGRNYDLFSILADVRNGYGFAGCKTGEGFAPIAQPKGIPLDCSKEGLEFMDSYQSDGHSHSYLTISEILAYDLDQITMQRGVIELSKYAELRETGGAPDSWSGGISGMNIITIDETQADFILDNNIAVGNNRYYVSYHWAEKYKDAIPDFIENTIPKLKAMGEPENVRIIFFFDN